MRSTLFWDITQRRVGNHYRRFGTYLLHLQESKSPRSFQDGSKKIVDLKFYVVLDMWSQKWDAATLFCPFLLPPIFCLSVRLCLHVACQIQPDCHVAVSTEFLVLPEAPMSYVSVWQLIRIPPSSRPSTRNSPNKLNICGSVHHA